MSAVLRPPGPPAQSVSVVVPTFARPESLARCLAAVAAQTRPADEVIVACRSDDRPTLDALPDLHRRFDFEAVTCGAPRLVTQMNVGVAAARSDVVALTDDDAAPRPDWLARILAFYDDEQVGAAGGRDVIHAPTVDSAPTSRPVGVVIWRGQATDNHHRAGAGVRRVDVLKGVNLSVRRALWGADEQLLGAGNQSHWEIGVCLRIRRLGWKVLFDPTLLVDHFVERRVAEPQRALRDRYSLTRDAHNEMYELVRWLPRWQWPVAVANGLLVGSRGVPGVATSLWLAGHGHGVRASLGEFAAASRGRLQALRQRPRRALWREPGPS